MKQEAKVYKYMCTHGTRVRAKADYLGWSPYSSKCDVANTQSDSEREKKKHLGHLYRYRCPSWKPMRTRRTCHSQWWLLVGTSDRMRYTACFFGCCWMVGWYTGAACAWPCTVPERTIQDVWNSRGTPKTKQTKSKWTKREGRGCGMSPTIVDSRCEQEKKCIPDSIKQKGEGGKIKWRK